MLINWPTIAHRGALNHPSVPSGHTLSGPVSPASRPGSAWAGRPAAAAQSASLGAQCPSNRLRLCADPAVRDPAVRGRASHLRTPEPGDRSGLRTRHTSRRSDRKPATGRHVRPLTVPMPELHRSLPCTARLDRAADSDTARAAMPGPASPPAMQRSRQTWSARPAAPARPWSTGQGSSTGRRTPRAGYLRIGAAAKFLEHTSGSGVVELP